MILEFGEWLPDKARLSNPGCIEAKNVFPNSSGYASLSGLQNVTNALTGRCQGAYSCRDKQSTSYNFAGDATKLYSLTGSTYTDISKPGGYTTPNDGGWRIAKFGERVILTNKFDYPQSYILGDTNCTDLTTDFKAVEVATVRDFVVFCHTYDTTNGELPNNVRWSGINNPTDYTPSVSTMSDSQLLADAGWIARVIGGEYGTIFADNNITRMTFTGNDFQFDEVETRGTNIPGSVIKLGRIIPYFSNDGIYVFNEQSSESIGRDKVDKWLLSNLDYSRRNRVNSVIDPINGLVIWAIPTQSGNNCSRLLFWNWKQNRFSWAEVETEYLTIGLTQGYTLEGLDALGTLDSLPESLDSRYYTGGNVIVNAFDSSHRLCNFSGSALSYRFEVGERQFTQNGKSLLNSIRVLCSGTPSVSVGYRNNQTDSVSYTSALSTAPSGRFTPRVTARYHSIRVDFSSSFQDALGVEIDFRPKGRR